MTNYLLAYPTAELFGGHFVGGQTNPGGAPHGRFTSVTHLPGGPVRLRFEGRTSQVHLLGASTNLVDWEPLGAATEQADDAFEFEDPDAAKFHYRYYRLMQR